MKKFFVVIMVLAAVCVLTPTVARADFRPWSFGNPTFINGNSFNGSYYLEKAKATNEYLEDPVKKIERMMNKLMDNLTNQIDKITDSIDELGDKLTLNLNWNFDLNNIFQSGSYNTAILGSGGTLGGFNPSWGLE